MATVALKFEGRIIQEYGLGLMVMIGRAPDNSLPIDNPAVSTHHACVFRDGDDYVVEDLDSTNGTFVNEKRVRRHRLQDGDVILIGKHTLVFNASGSGPLVDADGDQPTLAVSGGTVFLDTKQHRALLAKLVPGASSRPVTEAEVPAIVKPALLRVVSGRADRPEYTLDARTTLIGKSDAALIRLKGWFTPPVAVAIARSNQGYVATELGGRPQINGRALKGRRELRDGDVLHVSGVTLEFRLRGAAE